MNEFIITNIETKMEHDYSMSGNHSFISAQDPFAQASYQTRPTMEITLKPRCADEEMMRKIMNISQAGRTVTLNDTEYNDFIEPFKNEFIEFMMDKHPEKLMADPKAWDILRR